MYILYYIAYDLAHGHAYAANGQGLAAGREAHQDRPREGGELMLVIILRMLAVPMRFIILCLCSGIIVCIPIMILSLLIALLLLVVL